MGRDDKPGLSPSIWRWLWYPQASAPVWRLGAGLTVASGLWLSFCFLYRPPFGDGGDPVRLFQTGHFLLVLLAATALGRLLHEAVDVSDLRALLGTYQKTKVPLSVQILAAITLYLLFFLAVMAPLTMVFFWFGLASIADLFRAHLEMASAGIILGAVGRWTADRLPHPGRWIVLMTFLVVAATFGRFLLERSG